MSDAQRSPGGRRPGPTEQPADPDDGAARFAEDIERLRQAWVMVLEQMLERQAQGDFYTLPDPLEVGEALTTAAARMLLQPQHLWNLQMKVTAAWLESWQQCVLTTLGLPSPVPPEAGGHDRRFKADAWHRNPPFRALQQAYLATGREFLATVEAVTEGMSVHEAEKVRFYAAQLVDALAPSNAAGANPDVLQETLRTGGENLLRGTASLLEDMARGQGLIRVRQTAPNALVVGEDIAITPGKVVYQNALMQLIQYSPSTEQVDRRPLLIVPPWINKYYILDLSPRRSFIRWAVNQGITVFVISWVNPDARYAQTTFDAYLTEGTLAALEAVEQATGEREINAIGYCIGGTLLACTLGYLAARQDARVRSATFFTTLLDFSDVGRLGVFIDEPQIRRMEQHMAQRGYLEGAVLSNAFNMLQSNDLIWSFVVNNYLLGRDPAAFDLLHWNSDSTRMPYRMHSFYLRNMYLENRLREPGGVTLAGVPIHLDAIRTPAFVLAARGDHIAPWTSCYRSARLLGGRTRFVLGGSGHIAGVINPAGSGKYGYHLNDRLPATAQAWLEGATPREGSWWPEWRRWLKRHAGGQVSARDPGAGGLAPIEDAPGSYVRVQA